MPVAETIRGENRDYFLDFYRNEERLSFFFSALFFEVPDETEIQPEVIHYQLEKIHDSLASESTVDRLQQEHGWLAAVTLLGIVNAISEFIGERTVDPEILKYRKKLTPEQEVRFFYQQLRDWVRMLD